MTTTYNKIRDIYREAALSQIARKNLKGKEWEQYRKIRENAADQKERLQKDYKSEFDTRVEQERRRLLRSKGSPTQHLKYPKHFGYDQFDKESLNRQANRNVKARHEKRVSSLEKTEEQAVDSLIEKANKRNEKRGQAKNEFNRKVDRRNDEDRRQQTMTLKRTR